ncbi:MAG: hypothetical protein L0Y66_08745 [Myxococcaceae bacterium]|nr:hypothetical protein [Myxococcaceae bacterium]MCI0668950.1 hypothetical protein [Myxococcaceae bacterium]
MPPRDRKRLPSTVLEKARQLAGEREAGRAEPKRNEAVAPRGEEGTPRPGAKVKGKIVNALRKLHPMD